MSTDQPTETPTLTDNEGQPLDFERALAELEVLVEEMERGELSLERSVAHFERGMQLHQFCQDALDQASQKVEVLMRRSETVREGDLTSFIAEGPVSESDEATQ